MYSYQYSSAYQQPTSPTTEPTQPTEETNMNSYQCSSSSAMEVLQWLNSSTYQDPPSFSEETPQSAEAPSAYSYPDSSSQVLAESSQNTNLSDNSSIHCLYPRCTSKPFKRTADLQRHYRNTHNPDSTKEALHCDYPRCTRSQEPFRRRDHFRDHLREYHREDIQKRGVVVNEELLEDRYADNWWRCPRCLIRVYVSKDEFECPKCQGSCEPKRKERRRGH